LGAGVPTRPELSRARFPDGLQVTRLEGGGLRVEAAPALAGALHELLETLARSLRT
ncbi:MAG: hypothetical protein JWN48_2258, partial [Myxococcaceae bacterium]|nr:hypothetical protein [Myxococcaceae bacterium]